MAGGCTLLLEQQKSLQCTKENDYSSLIKVRIKQDLHEDSPAANWQSRYTIYQLGVEEIESREAIYKEFLLRSMFGLEKTHKVSGIQA